MRKRFRKTEKGNCAHCGIAMKQQLEFHWIDDLQKDKNVVRRKAYTKPWNSLCDKCREYPRCKYCGVIICDLEKHFNWKSNVADDICIDCVDIEKNVSDYCCCCDSFFNNTLEKYCRDGNFCPDCLKEVARELRLRHEKSVGKSIAKSIAKSEEIAIIK